MRASFPYASSKYNQDESQAWSIQQYAMQRLDLNNLFCNALHGVLIQARERDLFVNYMVSFRPNFIFFIKNSQPQFVQTIGWKRQNAPSNAPRGSIPSPNDLIFAQLVVAVAVADWLLLLLMLYIGCCYCCGLVAVAVADCLMLLLRIGCCCCSGWVAVAVSDCLMWPLRIGCCCCCGLVAVAYWLLLLLPLQIRCCCCCCSGLVAVAVVN